MRIMRSKTAISPYVKIDKTPVLDKELSWKSLGLLVKLISFPEDWKINLKHLARQKKDGKESTRSAMRELREKNYCHHFQIRESGRIVTHVDLVFEVPTPFGPKVRKLVRREVKREIGDNEDIKIIYIPVEGDSIEVERVSEEDKTIILDEDRERAEFEMLEKTLFSGEDEDDEELEETEETEELEEAEEASLSDDLSKFEEIFKNEFNIPFHAMNQHSVKRLLRRDSEANVLSYLRETFERLSENEKVKNVGALFTKKIFGGERQENRPKPIYKKSKTKIKTKAKAKDKSEVDSDRKRIAGITNYYIDKIAIGSLRPGVEREFRIEIRKFDKKLQDEYIKKFLKIVDG